MDARFDHVADALRDIARWERHRIELTEWHALRGQMQPPPAVALAGWRERLVRIEAGVEIMALLAPHEALVRTLDPALAKAGVVPPPTFWPLSTST